jgi:F0F1-type ATP synthase assembly protein I
MAEDDRQNTPEDDDATPQISVPSHDPLPLPPEVHYTRPSSSTRSNAPVNDYGGNRPTASTVSTASVKYTSGIAGGVSLMGSILGGYWLGSKIDEHWLHTQTPWGTIVMVLVGTFGGFWNLFRMLKRAERLDRNK